VWAHSCICKISCFRGGSGYRDNSIESTVWMGFRLHWLQIYSMTQWSQMCLKMNENRVSSLLNVFPLNLTHSIRYYNIRDFETNYNFWTIKTIIWRENMCRRFGIKSTFIRCKLLFSELSDRLAIIEGWNFRDGFSELRG
jgi:hypothetical protein